MSNRFQQSARRIIDGHFGDLKKSLVLTTSGGWDYDAQANVDEVVINTTGLKRKLTKSEFEANDVQIGDFALTFTEPHAIDVDNTSIVFDGVDCKIVSILELAAEAAQSVIARVK